MWSYRSRRGTESLICEYYLTSRISQCATVSLTLLFALQIVLTESIFGAAFGPQSSMGRPYYTTTGASREAIMSFRGKAYGLNGAVLAATGIADHAAFVEEAEERLAESFAGDAKGATASSTYIGGESRVHSPSAGYMTAAIAFPVSGGSTMAKVLKHCLVIGGADAFESSGLLGVYAGGAGTEGAAVVDSLCSTLTAAPKKDVIKRAIALAKAEVLFGLEGDAKSLAEAMTASVLESGSFSPAGVAEAFSGLTEAKVSKAYAEMLKANPALAAVGDLSAVPYQATLASRFS